MQKTGNLQESASFSEKSNTSYKEYKNYILHGDDREKLAEDCAHYLSLHDDSSSFLSIEENKEYMIESPRYNYITEIKDPPWNVNTIRQVIKKVSRLKNRQHLFTDKALWEVSRLLRVILTRLSKEMQRFAQKFNICTRNEVYSATQVIFCKTVSRSCIGNANQAYYLYLDSVRKNTDRHLRLSKSERAGLTISVGKTFRWMVRNKIAPHITDSAAVYLTAVLEYLVEEICCLSDKIVNKLKNANLGNYSILVDDVLPSLISKPDIWRACQPYEHLCVTRFHGQSSTQETSPDKFFHQVRHFVHDDALNDSVTCVGSRDEIETIIEKSSNVNNPDTPRHRSVRRRSSQSPNKGSHGSNSGLIWNNSAIDLLYELTKCSKLQFAEDSDCDDVRGYSSLLNNTHCEDAHPLSEWIKMSGVFTKSRLGKVVDENDVREAARVLLPGFFCYSRKVWPDLIHRQSLMLGALDEDTTGLDKNGNCLTTPLFFQLMLQLRDKEQMRLLIKQYGITELSKHDEQGMTLLMYACLHGNHTLCEEIIGKTSSINYKVPIDAAENDCIPASIKGWTALSFAVAGGHSNIVKLLLENGAHTGINDSSNEEEVLSPLHLAAAAGHLSIFKHLFEKHQSSSITTPSFSNTPNADFEENIQPMHPYSLAAAHGHRRILRKLFDSHHHLDEGQPQLNNMISLKEALTEDRDYTRRTSTDLERQKVLKEAMYESVEHGYIDITMEIRGLDVPWSYHMWITTLMHASEIRNAEAITFLVNDFPEVAEDEILKGFTEGHARLFFEIMKKNLNSEFAVEIAGIISFFYGRVPRKDISYAEEEEKETLPKIGTRFVNNREMADIVFNIEGKPFFAHKIILQNASKKLQELTKCVNDDGEVNIEGIKYSVFEAAMQFLYSGGILYQSQPDKVLELLACAAKLQLVTLKQSCEFESARHITSFNAVDVYTCAKNYKAHQLEKYCYHFFLANLTLMMSRKDFKDSLNRNQTLYRCLETEFMQALFGEQQVNNNVVIATYL